MSAVRLVPRQVQLRLDEPTDVELLALLRAERDARGEAWYDATDALTDLYRSVDPGVGSDRSTYMRVLYRVRALRAVVRDEATR